MVKLGRRVAFTRAEIKTLDENGNEVLCAVGTVNFAFVDVDTEAIYLVPDGGSDGIWGFTSLDRDAVNQEVKSTAILITIIQRALE